MNVRTLDGAEQATGSGLSTDELLEQLHTRFRITADFNDGAAAPGFRDMPVRGGDPDPASLSCSGRCAPARPGPSPGWRIRLLLLRWRRSGPVHPCPQVRLTVPRVVPVQLAALEQLKRAWGGRRSPYSP